MLDPRQEPSAVVPHAGICAGGRPQGRSLPRLPLTTSAPQPEDSSACSHRHTTEHVRCGGSRPLALPSATTDRSTLPPRARPTSPRNDAVRTFCTAIKIPTLAVERKILRRCYHTLRDLGDAALAMPVTKSQKVAA